MRLFPDSSARVRARLASTWAWRPHSGGLVAQEQLANNVLCCADPRIGNQDKVPAPVPQLRHDQLLACSRGSGIPPSNQPGAAGEGGTQEVQGPWGYALERDLGLSSSFSLPSYHHEVENLSPHSPFNDGSV